MRKETAKRKLNRRLIGFLIVTLTMAYLMVTVAVAQTSPKGSTNTSYSYNADPLSWGDVYSFDSDAFNGTNYKVLDGGSLQITYYNGTKDTDTGDGTATLYNYVGKVTYAQHTAPTGQDNMVAHTAAQFRNNITIGTVEAPIGNGVTIPVATTTGAGIYSVVPGSTGSYVVYVYSPSGVPSNVKYTLIDSYTDANSYAGSPATALTFTAVGSTGWYYSNAISISAMGWTAYKTSFSRESNTAPGKDTGIGTKEGEALTNTTLGSTTTYYKNQWGATEIKFDTVLSISFPSSVTLGPITKTGDSITINSGDHGTLTIKDIFNLPVATGSAVNMAHMPLFITPTATGNYGFTGFGSSASITAFSETLFEYRFEGSVTLTGVWEHMETLPTIAVSGGGEGNLDFYYTSTLSGSYVNTVETGFNFTPNWGDAASNVTVSYEIAGTATDYNGTSLSKSGQLTNGVPLAVRPAFGAATVTFTNSANDKKIVYTIESRVPSDAASYYIKGTPSVTYDYLDKAIDAAGTNKTVVVGKSGTAYYSSGFEYTLPSSVTLLIPYDEAASVPLYSNFTNTYLLATNSVIDPFEYKTLTFNSGYKLEVNGQLCPASRANAYDAVQTGAYGCLILDEGSRIDVNSGGSVHCFGYIKAGSNGYGKIYFNNGAKAYELMETKDYPGSASSVLPVYNDGAFPYREFYIKGMQVPAVFYGGSEEWVLYSLWGSSILVGSNPSWVIFIGSGSSYFLDTSASSPETPTSVTKSYDGTRQRIELDGSAKLQSLSVTIRGTSATTSNTGGVPIPSKYDLVVNSGNVGLNENLILGRGSTATINAGATFTLNGKNIYVLDSTEDKYTAGGCSGGDAKLDINGKVVCASGGGVYTSTSKAEVVSSAENGKIEYSAAPTAVSSVKTKTAKATAGSINVTLAELKNKDSSYTSTTGAAANDIYVWNKSSYKWEKNITITTVQVHFNPNEATGGSMSDQVFTKGVAQNLTANAFTRTGYEFAGWGTYSAQSPDSPTYTDKQSITLSEDKALYALWKETTYTATFKNYDDTILATVENVVPLRPASYTGAVPVKPATAAYTYEHSGWKDESTGTVYSLSDGLPGMTQDTTYTATFTSYPVPATMPTISTQPSPLSLTYGYTSGNKLSVSASPSSDTTYTLTYQWYSNSTMSNNGGSAISGATAANYTVPTGKNTGNYYFYCVVTAKRTDNNQTASITSNAVKVEITKASVTPTVTMKGWTYGETASNPSVSGNSGNGEVTYQYKVSTAADSTYTSTKPSNAGSYTVKATIASTSNYNAATATANFTIAKATPTVTAPTAKTGLIYTGSAQTLINAGSTTGGTMQYSLDNSTWSTSLPQGTAAQTYTVYYKVVGGINYTDVAAQSLAVTIANAYNYTITWGDLSSFSYTAPSYEWDSESMSYVQTNAGGWSSSALPYVTLTNNSTALAVHGALVFTPDAAISTWTPGMSYYSNSAMTTTANSSTDVAAGSVWTVYMKPTGTPDASWSGTKTIGTVRITVSAVE